MRFADSLTFKGQCILFSKIKKKRHGIQIYLRFTFIAIGAHIKLTTRCKLYLPTCLLTDPNIIQEATVPCPFPNLSFSLFMPSSHEKPCMSTWGVSYQGISLPPKDLRASQLSARVKKGRSSLGDSFSLLPPSSVSHKEK